MTRDSCIHQQWQTVLFIRTAETELMHARCTHEFSNAVKLWCEARPRSMGMRG
ncbi:hypothetical protein OF83DRAFT_1138276 [Amylostereum chailletii]|nr:hypothetical protein OF83DRAFT_1138276 [Amylostereum chailletii]